MKNNVRKSFAESASERGRRTAKAVRVPAKVMRLFKQCGYLRTPPADRQNGHAPEGGHRGYEVRFMAHSRDECQKIVHVLKACRIETGKPFNKGHQWRIPVYGREVFAALKGAR